jgi:hypothetical protein
MLRVNPWLARSRSMPVKSTTSSTAIKAGNDKDALAQLSDAVYVGQHLGEPAGHLIGHSVDRARRRLAPYRIDRRTRAT